MKSKTSLRRFLCIASSSLLAASIAQAADVTWDITPGTVGVGDDLVTGGTGEWNTNLADVPNGNWTIDAGANNIAWVNANNDTAVFEGTSGTSTLVEAITVGGLKFDVRQIISGNTLTLGSGTVIQSNVGNSNATGSEIGSVLAGTGGFTKTGTGWINLTATSSSLSGNINLQQGTLYTRHEALGSGAIVFTGDSTLAKVYNANANFTQNITINTGVNATMIAPSFFWNMNHAGVLSGSDTSILTMGMGGNTQIAFNDTANTFTGQVLISGGGTGSTNGGRVLFRSLPDSAQEISISNSVFRLAAGGVSMNFVDRPIGILNNNARIANDSTNSAVTLSFAQPLTATIANTGRTLFLSGVNTGSNTMGGAISNSANGSGAVSVTKEEAGKWILSGDNTYTGATIISGGTLLINGDQSLATGAVAVNGTSTLGGSGTIGGSVTLAAKANLAPGDSVGTLSIGGDLTISAMAGDDGLLNYELGSIAASDRTAVTGTLDIGTDVLGLGDFNLTDLAGLENGTYTLISSGTLTGSLDATDVDGTLGAATIQLQASGNNIVLVVSGLGDSGDPYGDWAATNAPTGGPDDDFDGDGVSNAVEFVLGGSEATNDLGKLPSLATGGGNMTFTFVRDQDSVDPGVGVEIEVGTDLAAWPSTFTVGADTASSDAGVTVVDNTDGTDTVTLTVSQAADTKKFARLKVTIGE